MATSCDGCGQPWQRHGLVAGSWCAAEEDARAKDERGALFRRSPRDQWLNELEDELRGLLASLPAHPGRLKLPLQARAWRAVARVLVTRELGANQFGRSYANAVWRTVEGYASGG